MAFISPPFRYPACLPLLNLCHVAAADASTTNCKYINLMITLTAGVCLNGALLRSLIVLTRRGTAIHRPNKDQDDATPRRTNKVARVLNSVTATCSAHKVIKSLIPVRRFWCVLFLLHRESPSAVGISVVARSQDDGRDATVSPKMVADRNYIIIDSWSQELSNRRCWRRPCRHTTLVPCIILLFYFYF